MNEYTHVGLCSAIEGDVAEVGLGGGFCADHAMNNAKCKSLDSFEIDNDAINKYGKSKDNRHKILGKNFLEDAGTKKYDFIYIDTLYQNAEGLANTKALVNKSVGRLKASGKLTVEFHGDCTEEREMRAWLKESFVPEVEKVTKTRTKGVRDYIMYWTPK